MSEGFLSRWARRKRDVRQAERDAAPIAGNVEGDVDGSVDANVEGNVEGSVEAADAALTPEAQADLLAQLPSLADLTAETDLIPFLRAGVPAAMRNAALRKMWSVDPAIRDFVSEAREYAYDWNTPGSVPGLGPLLKSDDVQAMLSRMVNRDPETRDPDPRDPDLRDPDRAEPSDPHGAPTTLPEPEPQIGADETLSVAATEPAAASEPAFEAEPRTVPEQPFGTREGAVSVPRLRRHGGARPA